MTIAKRRIRQAIASISDVDGLHMDPAALVEDVVMLSAAFPNEGDFMSACASTRRAIRHLIDGDVTAANLKYDFSEWKSYHYQHRAGQGVKATCRIVYRPIGDGIEVKGFGHRRMPEDFYRRMAATRRDE